MLHYDVSGKRLKDILTWGGVYLRQVRSDDLSSGDVGLQQDAFFLLQGFQQGKHGLEDTSLF